MSVCNWTMDDLAKMLGVRRQRITYKKDGKVGEYLGIASKFIPLAERRGIEIIKIENL